MRLKKLAILINLINLLTLMAFTHVSLSFSTPSTVSLFALISAFRALDLPT